MSQQFKLNPFTGQFDLVESSISPIPPDVPTQFLLDDGNYATALSNIMKVTEGSGTKTALGDPNQIKINVINDGFPWSDKAVSFNAISQNGYFCTAELTVSLPTIDLTSGSTVIIYIDTASEVTIQAGAGQQIEISKTLSTTAGTATSENQGDMVQLVYRESDTTWHAISVTGSFTMA